MSEFKKILSIILSIIIMLTCFSVTTFASECNGEEYHNCIVEDGYLKCTNCGVKVKLSVNNLDLSKPYNYDFDDVNNKDWDGTLSSFVFNVDEETLYEFDFSKLKISNSDSVIKLVKYNTPITNNELIVRSFNYGAYPTPQLIKYYNTDTDSPNENAPKLSNNFLTLFSLNYSNPHWWDEQYENDIVNKDYNYDDMFSLEYNGDTKSIKAYVNSSAIKEDCFQNGLIKDTIKLESGQYVLFVTNWHYEGKPNFTGSFAISKCCNHIYNNIVTKSATCTETGQRTYTCSLCGDTYTETIKALGHSYKEMLVDNENFKEICTRCGDTKLYKKIDDWTITYDDSDNTCMLYQYSGSDTVLSLPETLNKYKVFGMYKNVFKNNTAAITEIAIPYTYTQIQGLEELKQLKTINYHELSDEYIGEDFFNYAYKNNINFNDLCKGNWYAKQDCTKYEGDVYCKICGYTEEMNSHRQYFYSSHNYVISDKKDGKITYTCTQCPNTYTTECKHYNAKYDRHIAANCQHGEYDIYKCPDCDSEIKKNEQSTLGEHACIIKNNKAICIICGKEKVYKSYDIDSLDKQYTLSGDEISFYDSNYQINKSRYNCIKIKINKNNTPVYFYNKTERLFDSASYNPLKLRILDDDVIPQNKIDYYFLLETNSDYDMLKSLRNVYGDDNTFNQYIYDNSEKIKFNDVSIFNGYKPIYLDKGTYYLNIGDNFNMTSEIAISNKPIFKCKSDITFENPNDYQVMYNEICKNLPDEVSSEQHKEAFKDLTTYKNSHRFVYYKAEKLVGDVTNYAFSGGGGSYSKMVTHSDEGVTVSMICEYCGEIIYSDMGFDAYDNLENILNLTIIKPDTTVPSDELPEEIKNTQHNYVYSYKEPTCLEDGYEKWQCKDSIQPTYTLIQNTDANSYIYDYCKYKNSIPSDFTTLTFEDCVNWYNEYYKEKGRDFVTDYPLVKSISGILLNCTDDYFPIEAFYKFLLNHNPSEPHYCDVKLTTKLPSLSGNKYQHNYDFKYTPNNDDTHFKYGTCVNDGCYSYLTEKDLYRLSEDDLLDIKLNEYGYSKDKNGKWYKKDDNGRQILVDKESSGFILDNEGNKIKISTITEENEECTYDDKCTCIYCGAVHHKVIISKKSDYVEPTTASEGSYIVTDLCKKCGTIINTKKVILPKLPKKQQETTLPIVPVAPVTPEETFDPTDPAKEITNTTVPASKENDKTKKDTPDKIKITKKTSPGTGINSTIFIAAICLPFAFLIILYCIILKRKNNNQNNYKN